MNYFHGMKNIKDIKNIDNITIDTSFIKNKKILSEDMCKFHVYYDNNKKELLTKYETLNRINNYEYNHISKIIVNVFEKFIKEDIFPNDERLIVKWYPKEPEIKKVKIIDKKHTGYYFIKLKSDEILQFII